jgi:GTP1/Obg family GTP-binding protein
MPRKPKREKVLSAHYLSRWMPDGVTTKSSYYEQVFVNGTMDVADLCRENNPTDPEAPLLNTLKGWAQKNRWKAKRQMRLDGHMRDEPTIVREVEGRIQQIKQAYSPNVHPMIDGTPEVEDLPEYNGVIRHYADNLSDALRPFYLDSLRDNDLLKLERDIAIANAILAKFTEELKTGGSAEEWKEAKAAWSAYSEALAEYREDPSPSTEVSVMVAYRTLDKLMKNSDTSSVLKEISHWQENKRKLISTEVSRIAAAQNYLNINEAMRLAGDKLGRIMQIIRDENNPALSLKVCSALGLEMD